MEEVHKMKTSSDAAAGFAGIFLREEIFSCSICTFDETFQNRESHSASLRHVETQKRFNLFFVANSNGFLCKLCCAEFDWKEVKGHALSHKILPWWQPVDKYKVFFQNHMLELEDDYYCYPCDVFIEEWSSAYIHTSDDKHRHRTKTYPIVNDFSSWGLTQVPFHTFVCEALVSTLDCNAIQCTICECFDIGMKNIAPHIRGIQHQRRKVEFMREMRNWKARKAEQPSNSLSSKEPREEAMPDTTMAKASDDAREAFAQNSGCIYVARQGENEFSCKICDLKFSHRFLVKDHIQDVAHIAALEMFGCENIRVRKPNEYYCLCCDCIVLGINNVHQHVRGVRHRDSLSLMRYSTKKREQPTDNNGSLIEESEQSEEHVATAGLFFIPDKHVETRDGRKFHCRPCNEIIFFATNVQIHIMKQTHSSKVQELMENFSHQGGNGYHCRCCDCMVPGIENIYRHINGPRHATSLKAWRTNAIDIHLKEKTKLAKAPKLSVEPAEAVCKVLSYDHVFRVNDTMSWCRICDCKDIESSKLADHATGTQHTEALKRFADEILPKKNYKYFCKNCKCDVYSMNNVYGHLHRHNHKNFQKTSDKRQALNEATDLVSNRIDEGTDTDEIATKGKSPSPEDNYRQLEKNFCGVCGIILPSTTDLESHLAMHTGDPIDLLEKTASLKRRTRNDDSGNSISSSSTLTDRCSEKQLPSHVGQDLHRPEKSENSNQTKAPDHEEKPSIDSVGINGNAVSTKHKESADSTPRESISINGNSEKKLQSPKGSNIRIILQLLNSDDDYIHDMRDKLRETERGMKLFSINETDDVYCLVCRKNVVKAPKNYINHLNSAEHCECLEEIEKDHDLFELVPGQFSQYDLICQYIEDISEDTAHCHSCNEDLMNMNNILKRHISSENHTNTRKKMHLKAMRYFEEIKPQLQCDWYDIHEYWCVLCDEHFESEFNFAKHLKSKPHVIITRKSEYSARTLIYDFCALCALLWLGFRGTKADHCEDPAHMGMMKDGRRQWKKLPEGVQEHLITIDWREYSIDDPDEYDYGPELQENRDAVLMREDLERATESLDSGYHPMFGVGQVWRQLSGSSDVEIRFFFEREDSYAEPSSELELGILPMVHQCLTTYPETWNVDTHAQSCGWPFFKVTHKPTGLIGVISFKSDREFERYELIVWLSKFSQRCRNLILFLHQWLDLCGLAIPQGISKHALYWYVIFYAQRRFNNPPGLTYLSPELRTDSINFWDWGKLSPLQKVTDFREWVEGFFTFYGEFDYRYNVASPWLGHEVEKRAFTDTAELPEPLTLYIDYIECSASAQPFRIESAMCLQDPFNFRSNITGDVSKANLSRFREYCARSAKFLHSLRKK